MSGDKRADITTAHPTEPAVTRGVAEGTDVHPAHAGEDAEREQLLIMPLRDECACTIEDPCRRWLASIPHAIGVWTPGSVANAACKHSRASRHVRATTHRRSCDPLTA